MRVLFIGDVVGDPGISFLEAHLPQLIERTRPDVVIANGENASVTGPASISGFGITLGDLARLQTGGVDVITTGNHAWDGHEYEQVLASPGVLRPINQGRGGPGKGSLVWTAAHRRLGIINVAGRTAIPSVDDYADAAEGQLKDWGDEVDAVIVDMHAGHIEKQILAARLDGKVSVIVGTHTHVPTRDAQILPRGTGYVTDVGMVGPTGGVSGVDPDYFREWSRRRVIPSRPFSLASGPITFGAILAELNGFSARSIRRVGLHLDCFDSESYAKVTT